LTCRCAGQRLFYFKADCPALPLPTPRFTPLVSALFPRCSRGCGTIGVMASVEKRYGGYRVKYRDPLGRQRSRSFARKVDADRFCREVEIDKTRGAWLDPRDADVAVAVWAEQFLALCRRLSPTTQETYRRDLETFVLPRFGDYRLGRLPADEIEDWLNDELKAGVAASSVHRVPVVGAGDRPRGGAQRAVSATDLSGGRLGYAVERAGGAEERQARSPAPQGQAGSRSSWCGWRRGSGCARSRRRLHRCGP
jgi:hypothetical protein